jgi:hypothetical protein
MKNIEYIAVEFVLQNTSKGYKEAAHMAVAEDPTSQRSLKISPIWTTLINEEVSKLQ